MLQSSSLKSSAAAAAAAASADFSEEDCDMRGERIVENQLAMSYHK